MKNTVFFRFKLLKYEDISLTNKICICILSLSSKSKEGKE
jgi:hypothetical protein